LIKEKKRSLKAHFDLSRVLDMEIKVRGEKRKREKKRRRMVCLIQNEHLSSTCVTLGGRPQRGNSNDIKEGWKQMSEAATHSTHVRRPLLFVSTFKSP
jgi:hypothetical protein